MRPSMSGETPPPRSSYVVSFDVPLSFSHHFFTRPLGLVRLAFTELRKSIVSHYVNRSPVAESRSTDVRHASYDECLRTGENFVRQVASYIRMYASHLTLNMFDFHSIFYMRRTHVVRFANIFVRTQGLLGMIRTLKNLFVCLNIG